MFVNEDKQFFSVPHFEIYKKRKEF